MLFNSGYSANLGVMQSIVSSKDLVICDQLVHASISRALQSTAAKTIFYKHNNLHHLEEILDNNRDKYNGCLVVSEGVFSMEGDFPDSGKLVDIKNRYDARLYMDEAHALGILGRTGLGSIEKFNCIHDTDMIMGNLSKTWLLAYIIERSKIEASLHY